MKNSILAWINFWGVGQKKFSPGETIKIQKKL